jgi:hypothetical protein
MKIQGLNGFAVNLLVDHSNRIEFPVELGTRVSHLVVLLIQLL